MPRGEKIDRLIAGIPSNGKTPGERVLRKVGYFWTGLVHTHLSFCTHSLQTEELRTQVQDQLLNSDKM